MKKLRLALALEFLFAICWTTLLPPALGQTSSTQTPPASTQSTPAPPEKKKKVWTEDDLRKIRGGVNVVGETSAPAKAAPTNADKKKQAASSGILPAAEEVPEEPPARPPCKSWSWAAVVDAALNAQGVNLGREYWIAKSYGGEICTTELGNVAALASRIAGDYALEDASKVRVQAEYFPGLPRDFVPADRKGIPHIAIWKGYPYVITDHHGIIYTDENGNVTRYLLQDMTMVDPYEDRMVRYNYQTDRLQDLQGVVRLTVKPR